MQDTAFSLQNPPMLESHTLRISLRSDDFVISSKASQEDEATCCAVLSRPFIDRSSVNLKPKLWTFHHGDWAASKFLTSDRGSAVPGEVQTALDDMAEEDPSDALGDVLRNKFAKGEATEEDWKTYGEACKTTITQAMGTEHVLERSEGKQDTSQTFHLTIPSSIDDNDLSVQIIADGKAGYVRYAPSLGGEVGEFDFGLRPLLTKRGGDLEGEWGVSLAVVGVRKDGSAITELSSVDRKELESELQAGLEMLRDHPTVVSALGELNGQGKTGVEAGHEVPWITALTKLRGAVEKVFGEAGTEEDLISL